MKTYSAVVLSALAAFTVLAGVQAGADTFVTITPTGSTAATVANRWAIGSNMSGLGYIDGNSGFPGATATNFFTIIGTAIPALGNSTGFTSYLPTGAASPQEDVGNSLTPDSYSGLTYVAENLSLIGPLSFYAIHHRITGDYLALIQPSVPTVSDQKPMSVPGGPLTAGASGYFGLSYAADNPGGWGDNLFYYLRTNSLGETVFGSLIPALLSGPTDRWNLGAGRGFTDLAYTTTNVGFGFGPSQFYYLRLDPLTQTTFFGRLDPKTGVATDIQDLGGVYRTLVFTPTNVAYGANLFYSIGQSGQTITFAPIPGHTACDAPFTFVYPVASSGLPVTLTVSGPATISNGNVITLTGAVGTVVLTASQAGDATFPPASSVVQSFAVTACGTETTPQTITFAPIPGHTACDAPFSFVYPLASSGLPVTLTVSGPATISNGNVITLTGAVGTVVITASQAGDATFAPAPSVVQSFEVVACATGTVPQTITFAPIPCHSACDAPFTFVYPVASSGLPVTLTVSGPATISDGNVITLTGAVGTVVLTATQAGDATFAPAPSVVQSFWVGVCAPTQTPQTICFPSIPGHTACDAPFAFVYPLASSGLPVTLTVSGPATISDGNVITLTGALGTVVLTASQAGDATFAPAPSVAQSFEVTVCCEAPVITNCPAATACKVGMPFSFAITATGSPTNYAASPLPAGLNIDAATGAVTGTPTAVCCMEVLLGATNAGGTAHATLTITVTGVLSSVTNAFNGGGQTEIVWSNSLTGERTLWLMNGIQGGFTPASIVDLGMVTTDWVIAGTGDFNADNQTDILWQNTVTGQRALWLMSGTGNSSTPASIVDLGMVPTDWVIAGTGDFNADNQTDILWQNTVTGQRALWLMNGIQSGFTPASIVNLGYVTTDWVIAGTGDFNRDSQTDILWQNTVTGQRALWLMNGIQNGFTPASIVDLGLVPTDWEIASTGDYNGDNQTDILWQNSATGQRALWLMNGIQNGFTPASIVDLGFVTTDWVIAN